MKKKTLYRQVLLSLMAGALFAGQAMAADYTGVITGDASDDAIYGSVKKNGGAPGYYFNGETTIKGNGTLINTNGNVSLYMIPPSEDKKAPLHLQSESTDSPVTAVNVTAGKGFCIKLSDLTDIKAHGVYGATGISVKSFTPASDTANHAVYVDKSKHLQIEAISGKVEGSFRPGKAVGIEVAGNSTAHIEDSLMMIKNGNWDDLKEGKWTYADATDNWGVSVEGRHGFGYFDASGILAQGYKVGQNVAAPNITTGLVFMNVNANGAFANGAGSSITMKGGAIHVNKDNTQGYAALVAESGHVRMGLTESDWVNRAKVNIDGNANIFYDGNISDPTDLTTVNIALATPDSYMRGAIFNQYGAEGYKPNKKLYKGETNLWLWNGGRWTNEMYGKIARGGDPAANFNGSFVSHLTGGLFAVHDNRQKNTSYAGTIEQKDTNPTTIHKLTGNTFIHYAHEGDGTAIAQYKAGDLTISSADTNAKVILMTDAANINTADQTALDKVFNALAGKLYYSAYKTENNITGLIGISEGLTNVSQLQEMGKITFTGEKGQGTYVRSTLPTEQTTSAFDTPLTGNLLNDWSYAEAGVRQEDGTYVFTKDTTISVANLTNDKSNIVNHYSPISVVEDMEIDAEGHKLTLEMAGEGTKEAFELINRTGKNIQITADKLELTNGGITCFHDGVINLTGNLTGNLPANSKEGILLYDGGKMTVTGETNLKTKQQTVFVNGKEAELNLRGGYISSEDEYALHATNGIINANVAKSTTGVITPRNEDLVIKGNILIDDGEKMNFDKPRTEINIGLGTKDSSFHGIFANTFDKSLFKYGWKVAGNMYLSNGATWTHESVGRNVDTDSEITHFTGGSKAGKEGYIFQKTDKNIRLNDYSGHAVVVYEHNVSDPKTVIGGNTIIGKAKKKSLITLRTDNTGLNTASTTAADKNLVSETLNSLANKLYYTAYKDGEKNLTGKVEIAEGLTAQAASQRLENITYKNADGQGQYLYTPAVDEPTDGPIKTPEVFGKDRVAKATIADAVGSYNKKFVAAAYNSTSEKDMLVDMKGHALTLSANAGDEIVKTAGIMADAKNLRFSNGKAGSAIHITALTAGEGAGIMTRGKGTVAIDHDIVIDKVEGSRMAAGVKTTNPGDTISLKSLKIDQSVKATKDTMQQGAVGVHAGGNGAVVEVTDGVDVNLKGIGVKAIGGIARISGGRIVTDTDTSKYHKALVAENSVSADSSISINMQDDNTAALGNKVEILGDIKTQKSRKTGGKVGRVFLGLNTADSTWKGITDYVDDKTDYDSGEVSLWLANGAAWTHEKTAATGKHLSSSIWNGSRISALYGGSDTAHAGVILQKEKNPISVGDYSGYTTVIYEHDTVAPADPNEGLVMKGGDFKIEKAAANSGITLRTDNAGLNTASTKAADKNLVSGTLNKLANKLYYTAYKDGEKNLSGKVEIAEGLTAQSVSKRIENMTYKDADGQGQYLYTPAVDDVNYKNTPITGDLSAGADPSQQVYKNAGVLQNDGTYKFTEDATLTAKDYANVVDAKEDVVIDAAGKVLTMNQEGRNSVTVIYGDQGKKITVNAKKLVVDTGTVKRVAKGISLENGNAAGGQNLLTVNGDLDVTSISATVKSIGVYASGNSIVNINGNLTMRKDDGWAVNGDGFTFYGVSGLYSTSPWGKYNKGGIINVNGKVDLKLNGNGAFVNIGNGAINLNGGSIEVNKDNQSGYGALVAQCGTVNMNVVKDGSGNVTGAGNHDVNIKGNVSAKTGAINPVETGIYSTVNLGLNTDKSTLEGIVWNGFDKNGNVNGEYSDPKKFYGRINLWLANGGTWTNAAWGIPGENYYGTTADKEFHGSNPTNLYGGSDAAHAGVIIQKDKNPISVENYSGYTTVIYEHDTAVPADPNEGLSMKGGNFKVEKAAANSGITLRTDNAGLNTASTKAADKNLVSGTLNKLANKLYYTAYKDGEKNLTGKVEIAEGLTAQSASKRIENMTYKDADGQGQYLYTPAVDPDPAPEQDIDAFGTVITGKEEIDQEYVIHGVLKNDVYTFTKPKTTITACDKIAGGVWELGSTSSTVSNTWDKKPTVLEMNGHGLDINSDGFSGIAATVTGSHVEINNAGPININVMNKEAGYYSAGIYVNTGGVVDIHNGGDDLENKVLRIRANFDPNWKGGSSGIKARNGVSDAYSAVNIDGLVDIEVDGDTSNDHPGTQTFGGKTGLSATASQINIGGGSIKVKNGYAALWCYGEFVSQNEGVINLNVVKGEDGTVVGAGSNRLVVEGDISTRGGMGSKGRANMGLSTPESYWLGNYTDSRGFGVSPGQLGSVKLFIKNGGYWKGFSDGVMDVLVEGGDSYWTGFNMGDHMTLTLKDGATWYNAITKEQKNIKNQLTDSKLKYFSGDNGVIDMTGGRAFIGNNGNLAGQSNQGQVTSITEAPDSEMGDVVIDNYSGNATVIYKHDTTVPADPNEGLSMKGGDFKVEKAAANSGITLRTDNAGLNTASTKAADKNLVSGTLNKLANKLYYTAYKDGEKNLSGKVEIAEGLTAQSASKRIENMTYKDANGQGQYLYEPAVDEPTPPTPPTPPIIHGDKETVMMRGSKSAMTAAALLWRSNNNDLQRRMGDVRLGKEENGIWARYLGGKNKLDQQKAYFKQTYNIAQVGYDKKVGDWLVGAALDYGTGNDTYATGTGKEKLGSLALYGTRQSKDGQYVDLIVRGSQVKNDYTVYNEMHHKLDGNYKTWGLSFSAEYGKRFVQANGFYFDPSLELTAGHLNGKDYDAVSDYAGGKKMHVQQDGINSVIGRLGLGIGCETATSNLFAKVALAHEFGGTIRSTFSAAGEPTSSTEVDLKDTWVDLELGGSWQMNKDTYLYGTYTRNFGADLSNKWRVDAGVRFSF